MPCARQERGGGARNGATRQRRRSILQANLTARLPAPLRELLSRVRLDVSPTDGMLHGNDDHYLWVGASALNTVMSVLALAGAPEPKSILDFGAGAGRVTRWLQAAYPDAAIEACDLRESDLAFCRDTLGVRAWTSATDPAALRAPSTYDVIWAGSVLTHLSVENTRAILDRWLEWTNPGGFVIATLHGRRAVELADDRRLTYIDAERWTQILDGYRATGYGYADYPQTPGYGVSLTALAWTAALVESRPGVRLVALAEKAWDDHQDVVGIQRTD